MPGLVASSCPPPNEELTSAPVSPIPALSDNWKAWNEFVEATPETGFMQSSWWVDFRNTCGFENFGITLKGENGIAGGAVVLKFWYAEDSCFYYIQDGPVLPCDDPLVAEEIFGVILNEIEERCETEPGTVSHLRIEPRWLSLPSFVSGFRPVAPLADPYLEARDTRCIDLRPSEDAILAQMKPKGRTTFMSPGSMAFRLSRTHQSGDSRIFKPSTKKRPFARESRQSLAITFRRSCPCSRLRGTARFSSPNTRACGLPPLWLCISDRERRISLAGRATFTAT